MATIKRAKSKDVMAIDQEKNQEYVINTRYQFLMAHNGLRPNCSHIVIGQMGGGKSTLAKAIAQDAAKNKKVLVWLSEETRGEWHRKITENLDNIFFVEEKSLDESTLNDFNRFKMEFEGAIVESKAEVVIIDNVTTSFLYSDELMPSIQSARGTYLTRLPKRLNIALFAVAHTRKEIMANANRLVSIEDIRGSAKLGILAEYAYTFSKMTCNQQQFSIISIAKHRHHEISKKLYLLGFENGVYSMDKDIEWETVQKIYKNMDRLKG